MSLAAPLFALWAALLTGPSTGVTHRIAGIRQIQQGRAPFCAAAAALMGASRLGPVPSLKAFVRRLPVSADGIPWLELSDALRDLGVEAFVIEPRAGELPALIRADIPVIIPVKHGARRHAVLVEGVDATGFWVRDPARPSPARWPRAALKARWSARQAVVLPALGAKHPRAAVWLKMDRRYRALEWALRAEQHPAPNPQMLALYDLAVDADPSIAAIRFNRGRVRAALGQAEGACADFTKAASSASAPAVRHVAAEALAACPAGPLSDP